MRIKRIRYKNNHTTILVIFETNSLKHFDKKTKSEDKEVMKNTLSNTSIHTYLYITIFLIILKVFLVFAECQDKANNTLF